MKQDIRQGSIDTITANEFGKHLHEGLEAHTDHLIRELVRGVKLMKIPMVRVQATGTSLILAAPAGSNPPGPDSGYIWQVLRVLVQSNVPADTATVALYAGSDPSQNPASLIDSATIKLNANFAPGKSVYLWGGEALYAVISTATANNTYTLTGTAVEVPAEMAGKLVI